MSKYQNRSAAKLHYFFLKLSLRLFAKMAATARLTSPLLFLSSCSHASRGNPMAIMFATSLSFKSPAAGAGAGVAALPLPVDSLVSMLLSDADLDQEHIVNVSF